MKKALCALAFCTTALTCSPKTLQFVPDSPKPVSYLLAPSPRVPTIVLIPEDHVSFECQASVYLTLDRLASEGDLLFVAREGRTNETAHTNRDFSRMRYMTGGDDFEVERYRDFIMLSGPERRALAFGWAVGGRDVWPAQYRLGPSRGNTLPMIASVLLEATLQEDGRPRRGRGRSVARWGSGRPAQVGYDGTRGEGKDFLPSS